MPLPSKEKIKDRLENLPEKLSLVLSDEGVNDAMQQVTGRNNLSAEREKGVIRLTGYVLIGLLRSEDLAREMQDELHFTHQVATSLSEEINREVIIPALEGSISGPSPTSQPPLEPSSVPPATEATDDDKELLSPGFKEQSAPPISTPTPTGPEEPPTPTPEQSAPPTPLPQPQAPPQTKPVTPQEPPQQDNTAAPFVLHEETEIQPLASGGTAPLSRPQFFKSTAKEKPKMPPSTARLEIGAETVSEVEMPGKTKREVPKVVNYTGPVTQVDPFKRPEAKQNPTPKMEEEKPPEEVSPENTVNLKDLPR